VPFDLSEVLFIHDRERARHDSGPLRDRMEVLELAGYTEEEKLRIARDHLVARQSRQPRPGDSGVSCSTTTRCARSFAATRARPACAISNAKSDRICRKIARRRAEGDLAPVTIVRATVEDLLGAPRHLDEEMKDRTRDPGVAHRPGLDAGRRRCAVHRGVAHVRRQPAHADGPARRRDEGIRAHRTLVVPRECRRYGVDPQFYKDAEIHLHVPAGAIPRMARRLA
jgi:ATP-dependent Lon protease